MRHLLSRIPHHITVDMNHYLVSKFTKEDIWAVVRGKAPTKVAGNDGMLALFYHKFRHIVRHEVSNFCLGILNEGNSLDDINMTNIVRIPKQRECMI